MSLFRKFFYRKPPDGLLEISERIYVFDCCFSTDVLEEDNYKVYMEGILGQLRDQFPDASFMVFNFREGEKQGQISDILAEYDMTVMDYPRHYEGCPLLMMEVIHHFLKSCGNWLSLGPHNLLLLHCERGGWPVLAFMLAGLLIYRKQYSGEKRTLDMIYKQAPRELLPLLSPLNPVPSQLRYLQYISRRNVGSAWPPLDRALTLDCVILRTIPNFDVEGGCRPICRIYGQDPLMAADRTPLVLFSTPKKNKTVRLYKQLDCDLVKIDIHCHIQGDVVLECINLDEDLEHEKMMFRVMFNTAFIRSNILMLNRDSIDILWDAKDRFSKDFRAEVLLSEMDSAASLITTDVAGWEGKEGLPMEAFAKVQEIFSNVDWLDAKGDARLHMLQQIAASNTFQEKLESGQPQNVETVALEQESSLDAAQGNAKSDASENKIKISSPSALKKQSTPFLKQSPDADLTKQKVQPLQVLDALHSSAQPKIISPRIPLSSLLNPTSHDGSFQGSPLPIRRYNSVPLAHGITALLHDHATFGSSDVTPPETMSSPSLSLATAVESCLSEHAKPNIVSSPPPHPAGSTTRTSTASPSKPVPALSPPSLHLGISSPDSSVDNNLSTTSPPPPPPPLMTISSASHPPPPPPPPLKKPTLTACPPPPPPPPLRSGPAPGPAAPCLVPPPPPPPHSASKPPGGPAVEKTPRAPPMPPPLGGHISLPHGLSKGTGADPQSLPLVGKGGMGLPLGIRGRVLTRSTSSRNPLSANSTSKKVSLKPLHWVKVTRAMQGSLWAEPQKVDEASKAPEFDMSELESLFSVMVPKSDLRGIGGKSSRRESLGSKSDKVNLNALLALDGSVLDADQVENLIKFCPTKEEIELLKGYNGDKENLGKCEQFILELMIVPRVESKLRVFSFKIQFCSQVSYLSYSLNIVNSAAEEASKSVKLKRIMQTVLSLGNALNQGTARGSAIGFKLDSLLKLAETRARNNKMTLMHYLCKLLAEKLPEQLDFHKDLVSLEAASKIQLKYLAEEMQAISKGLEKVEEELTASENDGPVSQHFRKTLKEFLVVAEAEGRSLASLYSGVGRNADALATYFGEDPARFPFEQVASTLLNFVKLFRRAHEENCKQLELEKKRAQKEAEVEKMKISSPKTDTKHPLRQDVNCKL
ncbi:formin-like protein 18 isoform X3 [Magnolia sinica]|uniref:formin-like protein 18 isoform X3 n=1 Tax=Magnolia sinica TaxID=86752 RepID=UPI002659FD7A|nr:formin-like protein 18 isoform X3 [Magnolia sinica]